MFICRELDARAGAHLEASGIIIRRLHKGKISATGVWTAADSESDSNECASVLIREGPVDWLVVDQYSIDLRWEKAMRKTASKIMVIDDLTDRRHDCDLLLDQNLHDNQRVRYNGLVPNKCALLLGPRYALLNEKFSSFSQVPEAKDSSPLRVFISFGGSDPTHETEKALKAMDMLQAVEVHIDVAVGSLNSRGSEIKRVCARDPRTAFHLQPEGMAGLMSRADIAIGAAGTTVWERFRVGLPSVVIAVAKNQLSIAEALARRRLVKYLGWHERVEAVDIKNAVENLLNDLPERVRMSKLSKKLVDGNGARRVANILCRRPA